MANEKRPEDAPHDPPPAGPDSPKPSPYHLPRRTNRQIWRHRNTFIALLVLLGLIILVLIAIPY